MIKIIGRSLYGCVKWVAWLVALALVINVALACAILITPALLFFFIRAKSTAQVFEDIAEKVANRLAEEIEKANWKVELETEDDEEDLF